MRRVIGAVAFTLVFSSLASAANGAPTEPPDGFVGNAQGLETEDGAEVRASTRGRADERSGNRRKDSVPESAVQRRGRPAGQGSSGGSGSSSSQGQGAGTGGGSVSSGTGGGGWSGVVGQAAAGTAACGAEFEAAAEVMGAAGGVIGNAPNCAVRLQVAEPAGPGAAGVAGVPVVDPVVVARHAVLRLSIPVPEVQVGPPPEVNEWKMAAVGYPLWFWVEGVDRHAATVTEQGITVGLQARRVTTRVDTGDGNWMYCGMTPAWYAAVEPGTPSPGCGYRYQLPSLPEGSYEVTATTVWQVEWTALGQTGTLDLERTGPAYQLPVGELHALRIR